MKASFVIPAYQSAAWLPHAVLSAQKQTYPDIEIVVVNDASTDSTGQYLKWLVEQDQRVKVVTNPVNLGRSASRNLGNKLASGEVILVLDADDVATPNRAKITVEKIKKGADFVYGSAEIIDAVGTKLGMEHADAFNRDEALKSLLNRIHHSSVGYKKEVALKFPYQEGEISDLGIDDWAQQTAIIAAGLKMDFTTSVILNYRFLKSGISRNRDEAKVKAAKEKYLKEIGVYQLA
jgi:teichuronic acid biosynthesis glycosyltransferase TuaG